MSRLKLGYKFASANAVSLFFTMGLTMGLSACSSSKTALDDGLSDSDLSAQVTGDDLSDQGAMGSADEGTFELNEPSAVEGAASADSSLDQLAVEANNLEGQAVAENTETFQDQAFELEEASEPVAEQAQQPPVAQPEPEAVEAPAQDTEVVAIEESSDQQPILRDTPKYQRVVKRVRPVVVEAKPFVKDDFSMNAFYFVRSDDQNWVGISQKLYGRPDRADLIKSWNSQVAGLKVGQVIYYNSPGRPEDQDQMKPFAMDFGGQLEQVEVKQGDSLSAIAATMYGDPMAWKEISALNPQITNPNLIEPGQTLYVQPAAVDTATYLAGLVKQVEQVDSQTAESQKVDQDQVVQNPNPPSQEMETQRLANAEAVDAKTEPRKANAPPAAEPKTDQATLYLRIGILLIAGSAIAWLVLRIKRKKEAARFAAEEHTVHDFPNSHTGT